jgi:hypothetical protein
LFHYYENKRRERPDMESTYSRIKSRETSLSNHALVPTPRPMVQIGFKEPLEIKNINLLNSTFPIDATLTRIGMHARCTHVEKVILH